MFLDNPNIPLYLFSDPTTGAKSGVYDFSAERVAVPSTTSGITEEKDKQELYKNYCKATLPDEVIIVGFTESQKKNFKISLDEFISKNKKIEIKYLTPAEYQEYLNSK